jgi:hypothetical protein
MIFTRAARKYSSCIISYESNTFIPISMRVTSVFCSEQQARANISNMTSAGEMLASGAASSDDDGEGVSKHDASGVSAAGAVAVVGFFVAMEGALLKGGTLRQRRGRDADSRMDT